MGRPDPRGGRRPSRPSRGAGAGGRARFGGACLGVVLAWLVLVGAPEARGGDLHTAKDRPYPVEFRERVRDGIARALETLHGETQRPLWMDRDSSRFLWSADVLHAFRREGRGLELQAGEEIRARLGRRDLATVEEASLLVLALCARPLPDRDPFSKESPQDSVLTEPDRSTVRRAVELLLGAQVMEAALTPDGEQVLPEDLRRSEPRGGWSEFASLDAAAPAASDLRGTGSALLALEAAAGAGIPVPAERFLAALELLLRWQAPEGRATRLRLGVVEGDRHHAWTVAARARGWNWRGGRADAPEGDATANGVLGLAICRAALSKHPAYRPVLRARTDLGIRDGLAWIQRHFTVRRCPDPRHAAPPGAALSAYGDWLLRLVQIDAHLGVRQVGSHDLYREGADAVLAAQRDRGLWKASWHRPVAPLLVLLRAGPLPPVLEPFLPAEEGD